MSYTGKVVDQVLDSKEESLPQDVLKQAKLVFMDTIGCAIGGYCTNIGQQIVSMARKFPGDPGASLIGDGSRVSDAFACWANSCLSNLMDMDETFSGTAHIGNCVVSTALGVGQMTGARGKEMLHAMVLGFEVGSRIMYYLWPSPAKGVRAYLPSTWQVLASATTAGKLLGLDRAAMMHAYGLAGTVPPVPIDMQKFVERPMGYGKNVFGWTTMTGVFWTEMAKIGSEGTPNILDGDGGFWRIVGSDQCSYEELLKDWGKKYHILDTKFKPYPSCTWGHSSLDAVRHLIEKYGIEAEDIEEVRIRTLDRASQFLGDRNIHTIFDAQFSLPYSISMLLLRQDPGPAWFSKHNMFGNKQAEEIQKRISVESDPEAEKLFYKENGEAMLSTVNVMSKGGNTYTERVQYPKGSPRNPFSPEGLIEKFKVVAASLFSEKRIDEILDHILHLDELEDLSVLTKLLQREEKSTVKGGQSGGH